MSRVKLFTSLYLAGTGLSFMGKSYYEGSQALTRFRNGETVKVITSCHFYGGDYEEYETEYKLNSEMEAINFELTHNVSERVVKSFFFPYIGLNCASKYLMTRLILATNKLKEDSNVK
jgi:hypothetical protein